VLTVRLSLTVSKQMTLLWILEDKHQPPEERTLNHVTHSGCALFKSQTYNHFNPSGFYGKST
jgi:hypothetical protein